MVKGIRPVAVEEEKSDPVGAYHTPAGSTPNAKTAIAIGTLGCGPYPASAKMSNLRQRTIKLNFSPESYLQRCLLYVGQKNHSSARPAPGLILRIERFKGRVQFHAFTSSSLDRSPIARTPSQVS